MDCLKIKLLQKNYIWEQFKSRISAMDFWVGLVTSSLCINLFSLAFPIMLLQIYDRVIPNAASYTLFLLVIAVSMALFLEATLRIARSWITNWIDAQLEHSLSCEVFKKILYAPITDYERAGTGVYLEHMNAVHFLKDFYSNQLITLMLDLPFVFIFAILIFYIANIMIIVPLVMIGLLILFSLAVRKRLTVALDNKRKADDKRLNFIIAALTGIHSIKSMALEMQMLRRYERIHEKTCMQDFQFGLNSATTLFMSNGILQLSTVAVLALGSILVIQGQLSIGALAACVILTSRIIQPVSHALNILPRVESVKVAQQRLEEIRALPSSLDLKKDKVKFIKGDLKFENLCFRYNESQPLILNHVNLTIPAGEIVGIDARNITGKSTLLWLIMGILHPTSGRLLLDAHDLHQFDQQALCKQISYIPQHGALFDGTIMENITLFRPEYVKKAKEISEKLGLTQDICQLPKGFDTPVGRLTVESLSHGLKQRICIARALIEEPRVILFDEANASLDQRSDEFLKNTLLEFGKYRSWIIISSRPDTLKMANKCYTINNGELCEAKHAN